MHFADERLLVQRELLPHCHFLLLVTVVSCHRNTLFVPRVYVTLLSYRRAGRTVTRQKSTSNTVRSLTIQIDNLQQLAWLEILQKSCKILLKINSL